MNVKLLDVETPNTYAYAIPYVSCLFLEFISKFLLLSGWRIRDFIVARFHSYLLGSTTMNKRIIHLISFTSREIRFDDSKRVMIEKGWCSEHEVIAWLTLFIAESARLRAHPLLPLPLGDGPCGLSLQCDQEVEWRKECGWVDQGVSCLFRHLSFVWSILFSQSIPNYIHIYSCVLWTKIQIISSILILLPF